VGQYVWIGIAVAVFFIGIAGGYAIFSVTDSSQTSFSQMMQQMMSNPQQRQQIMDQMMQNSDFMNDMMKSEEFMNMMQGEKADGFMMVGEMSAMTFNPDVPLTMPMIDGYYNGEIVYFIHTEVSDPQMASMMTMMVNFPTLHIPELKDVSEKTGKVYVFTNGVLVMGPYGGGPFMYQIDVFDSIPGHDGYSQFRIPHLVTWNEDSNPRVLTSEKDLLEAKANGELTIQLTDNVVNAPMVVWKEDGKEMTAAIIPRIFESMTGVNGEVIKADTNLYTVTMKLHSENKMAMGMN